MPLNAETTELIVLAELAMNQSLRCERAAEAIEDKSLMARLTDLSRARTLLRLELEAKLRAMGGLPMVKSVGSGGLNGLHAAQRMDVVPDAQTLLRQIDAAEQELSAAMIQSRALRAVDPGTRLGRIIEGIVEQQQAMGLKLPVFAPAKNVGFPRGHLSSSAL